MTDRGAYITAASPTCGAGSHNLPTRAAAVSTVQRVFLHKREVRSAKLVARCVDAVQRLDAAKIYLSDHRVSRGFLHLEITANAKLC
jgi:hypothetical protein